MRAAVSLRDVVGETERVLVEGVGPGHRQLDRDVVTRRRQRHGIMKRGARPVQPVHELCQAAVKEEFGHRPVGAALVGKFDPYPGIQEGELAKPVLQRGEIEFHRRKGFLGRQEGDMGSLLAAGIFDVGKRALGLAMAETQVMLAPVPVNGQVEPFGQRIHHRYADAVEAAGDLVGIVVELTAGMKLGHDHLGGGHALFRVNLDRNAAAVIGDRDRSVGVKDHLDDVAMAGQRLVDGVVHHLIDHMVKPRAIIGVADIHARALAHRIKPFQDLDGIRAILLAAILRGRGIA